MAFSPMRSVYRRSTVVLIVLVGAGFSLFAWRYLEKEQAERIRSGFLSRAQTQATVAAQRLGNYEEMVYSLRDTFLSQQEVTRDEFAQAAKALLSRHTGVQALEWVQIVPRSERAAFEQKASRELGQPFVIRRRQPDNSMRPAEDADEYWVINYLEPLTGNETVLGYDIISSPVSPLLAATRADRQFRVSPPFRLIQSTGENPEPGVTFILPVAHADAPESPVEGFIQGVFLLQTMLAQSHQLTTNEALNSYYVDVTPGLAQPELLYVNLAGAEPMRQPGAKIVLPPLNDPADFHETLKVGGRQWRLIIRANPVWVASASSMQPAVIFTGSLIITGLLALFINNLLHRTGSIEREVQERTRELRASEARLQGIIDHSPALIFLKDLDGRYLLCNQPFAELCQRPSEEIVGRRTEEIFPAKDAAVYRVNDAKAIATGRALTLEEAAPAGSRVFIVQRFPLLDEQGRAYALCGIATDITERKAAEAEKLAFERNLQETQKLESLGVLAGGIAHDFNNILTAVIGNASLIRMDLAPTDPNLDNLLRIEKAVHRAADLCNKMLTYAGKGHLTVGPINLSTLVRDTTAMLEVSVRKNCRLALHLADHMPSVLGDTGQLNQIVMNLVINASDAIGEQSDGKIEITTFTQQAEATLFHSALKRPNLPSGLYAGLEVRDNGCGMSPETLARIFEPFYTTKFAGRGLGLSAVLGIVNSHRGALFVESRLGAGTSFRLLLPTVAAPAATNSTPAIATGSQPLAVTVLIVDDEEAVRQVAAGILRRHGATVLLAADGSEALEQYHAQKEKIDFILLDLTMPGLSGETVLRRLQEIGARQKIVVMSGYSEEETMQRCTALGAVGFLRKPFETEAIVAKLRAHLA